MPTHLPSSRDAHVNRLLTDLSIAHGQDLATTFVADRAFTPMEVEKQSDKYTIWDKDDFFRIEMDLRADGTESRGAGQRLSQGTYFCDTYALHTYLTRRQRQNAKNEVDLEGAKVRYLMHQAKLKRDKIWAAAAFAASVWSGFTDQTGVSGSPSTNEFKQWSDSSSTPIIDITEQRIAMETSSGYLPNIGVTNTAVMNQLMQHSDFLDRIKHTQTGVVSTDLVAQILGLDEILIGRAVENTGNEGGTASMSRVFDDRFLLLHRTPTPSTDLPTAGVNFIWSEFDGIGPDAAAIKSWEDKDKDATKYEAEISFDVKVTAASLGGIFLSAIA